ncbi:uncharacterized protein LOC105356837 [Oryzias latipes]|uniref:uncharacterized protein LOC105356837 n=1 Tax=Oryzias latipes TaxID=8090 RepID=UPI000CE1B7B8|nr:uncharacterized protein LOC105356837 [Oryzias latipes]
MLHFSRNVGLSGAMICYITWTFCNADATKISGTAGGTVTLNCNASISNLSQLTWELNGELLFVFTTLDNGDLFETSAASTLNLKLNLNLNRSDIQRYALVIEKANEFHSGNYTCETTTGQGISKQTWELLITEKPESVHIYIYVTAVAVPVCVLLILVCVVFWIRSSKQKPKKIIRSLRPKKQQAEEVYENCLEIDRYHQRNHRPSTMNTVS